MYKKVNNFPCHEVLKDNLSDTSSSSDDEPSIYETQTRQMSLSVVNSVANSKTTFRELNEKIHEKLVELPTSKQIRQLEAKMENDMYNLKALMDQMDSKVNQIHTNTLPTPTPVPSPRAPVPSPRAPVPIRKKSVKK